MFNEQYVQEILAATRPGMTDAEFDRHCQPDLRAGYVAEATEAKARYFAQRN